MDIDFSSLASRIAQNVAGLRGCIIASRDGLVLGAYPADGEAVLRPAWLRFAALGEVEKGFIEFAGELWVFVQRGPYSAFSVSAPNARPGLILEELEQVLRSAEEARAPRESGGRVDLGEAPRSKPRTPLHPEPRVVPGMPAPAEMPSTSAASELQAPATPQAFEAPQTIPDAPAALETPPPTPVQEAPIAASPPPPPPVAPVQPSPVVPPVPAAPPAPPPVASPATPFVAQPEDANVDRVLLSQEFAQLLEETGYDDDA